MTPADLATWLLTYAVHSTVLLGAVWLLTRHPRLGRPAAADALWKAALVGGFVTATVHQAYGPVAWRLAAERADAGHATEFAYVYAAGDAAAPHVEARPAAAPVAAARRLGGSAAGSAASSPAGSPAGSAPALARRGPPSPALPALPALPAQLLLSAWAVIASLALARLAWARVRLARWLAPRENVDDPALIRLVHDLAGKAGLPGSVRLTWSPELASPVALGSREICLPSAAFDELDEGQLRAVLAHEVAHLARRDPLWLAFSLVVERVFFFQPLNAVARVRMQDAAEFLCDGWAARASGTGIPLATSLAHVAEWMELADPRPLPLTGMAESPSQLLRRVHRLMEPDAAAPAGSALRPRIAAALMVAATAAAVPGIGAASAQAEPEAEVAEPAEIGSTFVDIDAAVEAKIATAVVSQLEVATVEQKVKEELRKVETRAAAAVQGDTVRTRILQALIEGTRDSDAEVRLASVEALGDLEDRRATQALVAALGDDVTEVRRAAVHALGHLEDPATVDALLPMLRDADAETRMEAAHTLGNLGDRRATDGLLPLLRDPSVDVRRVAAEALGDLEDPRAAEPLAAALGDEDAEVRQYAAHSLGHFELTRAPDALLAALRDPVADVRMTAAETVGGIGDARAVPALREMLGDESPEIQKHALEALGDIGTPEALDAIVSAMQSRDAGVRRQAAEALGRN